MKTMRWVAAERKKLRDGACAVALHKQIPFINLVSRIAMWIAGPH